MMPINPEPPDELLKEYKSSEDIFGTDCLLQQLTQALVERARQAELTYHLGYEKHASEVTSLATPAMARSRKPSKASAANSRSTCPVTVLVTTNRSSSKRDKFVLTAS